MTLRFSFRALGALSILLLTATASAGALSAQEIVDKLLESDPFGFGGATVTARLVVQEKGGGQNQLAFTSRSVRYDGPYSKSIVRFTAPADLAGAGFLQVQKRGSDDERMLFLPELKRSRRIAGSLRGSSFMGTAFSYADLDWRDFREADVAGKPDEDIGKHSCYRVDVVPRRSDSPYARLEAWIRKDNMLPLKLVMYDRTQALHKTFSALEVRRVEGQWFVTKSRMVDHTRGASTELLLDNVAPLKDASEDEFSVRNLEKM